MKEFANKLRILREENNLTQPQLAKILGVSKGIVSFWENDINEPKATYIKLIASYFNVSTDYLLGLEDDFGNKTYSTNITNSFNNINNSNVKLK